MSENAIPRPLTPEELELWMMLDDDPDGWLQFVPMLSRGFAAPVHLRPVAALLARAEHEGVRGCVSVPPRHGKTELLLHAIARWLVRHPDQTIAYVTYARELAQSKSRRARDLAIEAGVQLRQDARTLHEWRTVQGGGVLAYGLDGQITGHGANLIFLDDPIKNREDAESPAVRENTWRTLTSTLLPRLEPGGSVLVVHTRWSDDDVIGRLQRERETRWDYVNLPALDADGRALWPERWPADQLDIRRKMVGQYDWASLYMGMPRPRGGRLFHEEPQRYSFADCQGARIVIGCDPAATAKTTADYSCAVVLGAKGFGPDQVVEVLEVFRAQVEVPQLVHELARLQLRWGCPVAVESTGGFKAVPQMLRALALARRNGGPELPRLRIVEVQPQGDKFTRALAVAAAWNDGRVRLPAHAPWVGDFLDEVSTFTGAGDAHDDQVDALAHAFNVLNRAAPIGIRASMPAKFLPFG